MVRRILSKWYGGKFCVHCGRDLSEIDWLEHKPALMSPECRTVELRQVAAERLPEVLKTHCPVCWNCHIAETFRRMYPDLVVNRPWTGRGRHAN